MEESLIKWIVKHTVYRVSWDGNVDAHTEKQEHQTVHTDSPSPAAAKGSPVLQPQTTRIPAVISAIPNFPKTYDSLWESLLPVTQVSISANILVITGEIKVMSLTKQSMDKCNKSSNKECK